MELSTLRMRKSSKFAIYLHRLQSLFTQLEYKKNVRRSILSLKRSSRIFFVSILIV